MVLRHLLNLDTLSKCSPFTSRQSWIRPTSEWRTDQCMYEYTVRLLTDIVWWCELLQHRSTRGGTGWGTGRSRSLPLHILHCTFGLKLTSPVPLPFPYILRFPAPFENYLALLDRRAPCRHFVLQGVNSISQRWCSCDERYLLIESHYIKYATFWPHTSNVPKYPVLHCVYILQTFCTSAKRP